MVNQGWPWEGMEKKKKNGEEKERAQGRKENELVEKNEKPKIRPRVPFWLAIFFFLSFKNSHFTPNFF